jgi:hypothetical protein
VKNGGITGSAAVMVTVFVMTSPIVDILATKNALRAGMRSD